VRAARWREQKHARKLAGSSFKAIGALSYAKLGWLNWETKQYDPSCVLSEQLDFLCERDEMLKMPKLHGGSSYLSQFKITDIRMFRFTFLIPAT
jgi:hypothetical protein